MKDKKHIVQTLAISALIFAGIFATPVNANYRNRTLIIEKLAKKFDFDEKDLQEFAIDHHEQKEAEKNALMEEILDEAVSNGILTENQKEELMAIHADMYSRKKAYRILTTDEKIRLKKDYHDEIMKWESETNTSFKSIMKASHVEKRTYSHHFGYTE